MKLAIPLLLLFAGLVGFDLWTSKRVWETGHNPKEIRVFLDVYTERYRVVKSLNDFVEDPDLRREYDLYKKYGKETYLISN